MSVTLTLPNNYQYVGAALFSTVALLFGQGMVVGRYRKRAGIKYPQMYAEKAEAEASKDALLFNCAQRAHQNTLENIPLVFVVTTITGLQFPVYAASACALWTLSRISYTRGYVTGDPNKRGTVMYLVGSISMLTQFLFSAYTVGGWLYAGFSKHLA
ncbi:membrane-associated proteins in eicosanoid and glutathione metabolism [Phlegmacium glaucopus]|nr:membrane-associated proteins in eicosanoid and glutathione metabolism [Phlegmacium glaucopus]